MRPSPKSGAGVVASALAAPVGVHKKAPERPGDVDTSRASHHPKQPNRSEDNSLLSLTHHGRGRPTRRRGFDDDFSYNRAPSGEGPRYQAPSSPPQVGFGPELESTVKWFNPDKGFGFVALADGSGDVFLHANALTNAGHSSVSPGNLSRKASRCEAGLTRFAGEIPAKRRSWTSSRASTRKGRTRRKRSFTCTHWATAS